MALKRLACALALLAGTSAACEQQAEPLTELVVVVDSDLAVPAALDEIRVQATSPDEDAQESSAALGADEAPLPRSLGLHHAGGSLGPFRVTVEGRRAGSRVIERVAEVSFVRGKSLVLPLHLVGACRAQRCDDGESCGERGCQSIQIDSDQLAPWEGERPRLDAEPAPAEDAGGPARDAATQDGSADAGGRDAGAADAGRVDASADAGMCMAEPEQCNQLDDDCDGRIDNGFNLMTDLENCGRCGVRCNAQRREVCCRGTCTMRCQ